MTWNPKPLKSVNLNGIFSYGQEEEYKVVSGTKNRWQTQRDADGTPHTRHGHSSLSPAPVGPKLHQRDLVKSKEDEKAKAELEKAQKAQPDPEAVLKSYFDFHADLNKAAEAPAKPASKPSSMKTGYDKGKAVGGNIASKVVGAVGSFSGGKSVEGCDEDKDKADKIEKSMSVSDLKAMAKSIVGKK